MNETKNTQELNIKEILNVLVKRIWFIFASIIVAGIIAFIISSYVISPQYTSTTKLFVNNTNMDRTSAITTGDLSASKSLVSTYIAIIKSDVVLDEVINKLNLSLTPQQLNDMIFADAINQTEVFYVSVTTQNPQLSTDITNTIATIAPEHLSEIVDGSSAKIVENAKVPKTPSYPNTKKNTTIGALIGLLLSCIIVIFISTSDTRITSETDIKQITDIPILSVISDFNQANTRVQYGYGYGYGGRSEENNNEKQ